MLALLPLLSFGFISSDSFDKIEETAEGWFLRVALVGLALFVGWGILMYSLVKLGFFQGLFEFLGGAVNAVTGTISGVVKIVAVV